MILAFSIMSISRRSGISFRQPDAKADARSDPASTGPAEEPHMMLAIFATLSSALLTGYFGPRWLAVLSMLACLALSIALFLFEIYSPEYGFRMPWLQVRLDIVPQVWWRGDPS
jgi:hypothetical protein